MLTFATVRLLVICYYGISMSAHWTLTRSTGSPGQTRPVLRVVTRAAPAPTAASVSAQWRNCHFSSSPSPFPAWQLSLSQLQSALGRESFILTKGRGFEQPENCTSHRREPQARFPGRSCERGCPLSCLLGEAIGQLSATHPIYKVNLPMASPLSAA